MRVGLFLVLTAASWAQTAGDITVTLRTADGKTQFRLGEIVAVELVFSSSTVGRYQVWDLSSRQIFADEYDRFSVEPQEGFAAIIVRRPAGYNGPAFFPKPMNGVPVKTPLTLNDWIAFRKPGHYRLSVETSRAMILEPPTPVTLRSNAIDFDVVAPEPGWVESQVSRAAAILRGELRGDASRSALVLRFLGTLDAAETMVRFCLNGPPGVQYELIRGLLESPYRQEILAAMDAGIANGAKLTQQNEILLVRLRAGDVSW